MDYEAAKDEIMKPYTKNIEELVSLGYDKDVALNALLSTGNTVKRAIDEIEKDFFDDEDWY